MRGLCLFFACSTILLAVSGCASSSDAVESNHSLKRIAITFDDAPRNDGAFFSGPERTQKLIEALNEADVGQAAFFVTTRNIKTDADADRVRAYAAAGHVIANHSHAHDWLRNTAASDYLADIDKASKRLEVYDNGRPWFRYPYLDEGRDREKREAVASGLRERGLSNGYVTVDNYDWYLNSLAVERKASGECLNLEALKTLYVGMLVDAVLFYDAIALEWHGRSPAHVLLLHENDLAALFVADLAVALREKGWRIVSADEAYEDVIGSFTPRTSFNGQGRVAAIAHALGASGRDLVQPLEDETVLDALFTEQVTQVCETGQ